MGFKKDDLIFMWLLSLSFMGGLTLISSLHSERMSTNTIAAIQDNGCASHLEMTSTQRQIKDTYGKVIRKD